MPNDIGTEAVGPLSFDEAFTLHHRAVFRTARAVVRDSALAEDVTQEVFFTTLSQPELHARRGSFAGVAIARDSERGAKHLAGTKPLDGSRQRVSQEHE
jgi:hypothetical protein